VASTSTLPDFQIAPSIRLVIAVTDIAHLVVGRAAATLA
jgi:hypothetical protein